MARKNILLIVSAVVGFLGIALGASGKHALSDKMDTPLYSHFETGLRYHQTHATALLAIALASACVSGQDRAKRLRTSGWMILAGIIVFSGSLYILSFTGLAGLGKITPLGGILLMAGWLSLCRVATAQDS
jgi:uncharacterized membrane protein YgdD (TMEM256/DUF423 family)